MRARIALSLIAAVLIAAAAPLKPAARAPAPRGWRPIVSGQLGNGLRYAILPRPAKEPGVALLMQVSGGFIAERRPGERGLAHLIEHLVFDSPVRAAPGERAHFVKVGLPLTFPAPRAATTDWRESRYFLSTRTRREADIGTLLGLFRQGAQDLTFRADTVAAQRADVTREMTDKLPGNLTYARYIAAVGPGTPTDVIDGQNSDEVQTASIATIRRLYRRLYRPEHVTIVIVGNIDPGRMARLIRRHFADWRGAGARPKAWPIPPLRPAHLAPLSFSAEDPGRRGAVVTIAPAPPPPRPTPTEQIEHELMDRLVIRLVNARLARFQGNWPLGKYGMFIETGGHGQGGGRRLLVWDNFEPGKWREATEQLVQTVCGFSAGGFAPDDIGAAKTALLAELTTAEADSAAEANVVVAQKLADALGSRIPLPAPAAMLRHARAWLPKVDKAVIDRWWQAQWQSGQPHVRVETPEFQAVAAPAEAIRQVVAHAAADTPGCPLSPPPAASPDR